MAEWEADAHEAGQKMGLSAEQINEWLQKYGSSVITDASQLIQNGFSVEWVTDTLNNLGIAGPTVLSLILGLKRQSARAGASEFGEGQKVGVAAVSPAVVRMLIDQVEALLPNFLSGFQLIAARVTLEALAKMLAAV